MQDSQTLNNTAAQLFVNGEIASAEKKFLQAIREDENNVTALNNLGFLYACSGNTKKSR